MARTAGRLAIDDPMYLLVATARRFLPQVRAQLGPRRGLIGALTAYAQDRDADARQILATVDPRTRAGRALRDLLRLELGWAPTAEAPPPLRARAAWQRGDLSEATEILAESGPSRLATRYRSELALMTPGAQLPAAQRRAAVRRRTERSGYAQNARRDGVLAILTNARPVTASGYTQRSQQVFDAIAAGGRRVDAVTRIGYPATIGKVGTPVTWRIGGVRYRRLPAASLAGELAQRLGAQVDALAPLVRRLRPGVLHTTTDWTNAVVTSTLARRTDLPWVYEMRGLLELTWIAARPPQLRAHAGASERVRLAAAREAELAGTASAVVALSQVQRTALIARGVPAERITVIPNSVSDAVLARPPISPSRARATLGLPTRGLWVGSVTSVVDYEGLDVLVEAVAAARDAGHDLRCAIVGDGVARPQLAARVADLELTEQVILPGRVPAEQALRWYEALDVFVVPRKDTPVCRLVTPVKPLAAMALRRPIVASDLPALTELIGEAGLFARPDDPSALAGALTRMADTSLRESYGGVGRATAARQTWQQAAAAYETVYRKLRA